MSPATCPPPRKRPGEESRPVEVLTFTVHPRGTCATAESLADRLDAESRAHAATRQALADAELRAVAEPFLQVARDRLARRSWEPISDEQCRRFLGAFGALPESEVRHG